MIYKVTLNCTVEQYAELHVEASSPEEAAKLAEQIYHDDGADWQDADSGIHYGIHNVEGPDGKTAHIFKFQED
jgi:hypothetical protein